MSDAPSHQQIGSPKSRPSTVIVAAAIMLVAAVVGFANGIATLSAASAMSEEFRARARLTDAPPAVVRDLTDSLRGSLLTGGAVTIGLALLVGVLAMLIVHGRRLARVVTWAILGLSVCCGALGLLGTYLLTGVDFARMKLTGVGGATSGALNEALRRSIPDWLIAGATGLTCFQALGYIAVAVLLALPASNAFFRKAPPLPPPASRGEP